MNYQLNKVNDVEYVEILPDGGVVASERDALDLVSACGENLTPRLMIHAENLSPEFFDLKTRLAGEVLLKFGLHGRFGQLLDKRGKNAVFASQVFTVTQGLQCSFDIEGWFGHVSSLFVVV